MIIILTIIECESGALPVEKTSLLVLKKQPLHPQRSSQVSFIIIVTDPLFRKEDKLFVFYPNLIFSKASLTSIVSLQVLFINEFSILCCNFRIHTLRKHSIMVIRSYSHYHNYNTSLLSPFHQFQLKVNYSWGIFWAALTQNLRKWIVNEQNLTICKSNN